MLRYCMVLHCWLRRAGCISQDNYLLYILYGPVEKSPLDLHESHRTSGLVFCFRLSSFWRSEYLTGKLELKKYKSLLICKVCWKEGQTSNIKHHVEKYYITALVTFAKKTCRTRKRLKEHIYAKQRSSTTCYKWGSYSALTNILLRNYLFGTYMNLHTQHTVCTFKSSLTQSKTMHKIVFWLILAFLIPELN